MRQLQELKSSYIILYLWQKVCYALLFFVKIKVPSDRFMYSFEHLNRFIVKWKIVKIKLVVKQQFSTTLPKGKNIYIARRMSRTFNCFRYSVEIWHPKLLSNYLNLSKIYRNTLLRECTQKLKSVECVTYFIRTFADRMKGENMELYGQLLSTIIWLYTNLSFLCERYATN